MAEPEWLFDDRPDAPGWYAIIKCWDPEEGLFPAASKWDGSVWDTAAPISQHAGPFDSKEDAAKWAYDHDPEL